MRYHKRKILSGINVSERAGKVSNTTNALDVHRLPTPLKSLKNFLRWYGRRFQSPDEVKSASPAELKDMGKNEFQKCFNAFYKRWQKCAVAQGSYFKVGCVSQKLNRQ
ncbi:hypothetical protein TNCV_1557621 [Trichonephila clavipes]|nr:hypothetical protein TNCV_1557621 [Trichonephila clavipes]